MTALLINKPSLNAPKQVKLANGLTIIAEQMPVEAVNLNLWFKVGSILESDDINGMAHFLEHMVFKGTPQLKSGEFERLIEERGAITNAATSQEYTHYYITTAPQDFRKLAPLQLDVVLNPSIPEDGFERERLVVLEEIRRSEDNPRRRIFYRAMETCFNRLPYRRPVLGPSSVIQGLTVQQMRDFHQWYQPQSLTAVVVGNLPVEAMIDTVATSFDKLYVSRQAPSFPSSLTPEAPFTEIVRREYEEENLQQAKMVMFWRVPGLEKLSQTYALDVLAVILGQGKVSRLYRDLREVRGLVTHISTSNMSQGVQGIFYISAQLPPENVSVVENAIKQHLHHIQSEAITEAELTRIRTQVANRFVFSNERPSDRANLYGYYHSQLQDLEPAINYPDKIKALNVSDIREAAVRYLSSDAYGMVVMNPNES